MPVDTYLKKPLNRSDLYLFSFISAHTRRIRCDTYRILLYFRQAHCGQRLVVASDTRPSNHSLVPRLQGKAKACIGDQCRLVLPRYVRDANQMYYDGYYRRCIGKPYLKCPEWKCVIVDTDRTEWE
jgi:hypothetical protein